MTTFTAILDKLSPNWRDGMFHAMRSADAQQHRQSLASIHMKKWTRLLCLRHYGMACACCGYADINKKIMQGGRHRFFLEFDHIAGYGGKHARERKEDLARWLILNGFPVGFRTLCRGCNSAMEPNESTCETHKWKWKD